MFSNCPKGQYLVGRAHMFIGSLVCKDRGRYTLDTLLLRPETPS